MDLGNGFGFWNTMLIRIRSSMGSTARLRMFRSSGSNRISPE
jgi:hypothetical protein